MSKVSEYRGDCPLCGKPFKLPLGTEGVIVNCKHCEYQFPDSDTLKPRKEKP